MMFAVITPALITGAVAGRMKFKSLFVFIIFWSLIVYYPLAHMVWAQGGLLGADGIGALDFAGGDVVHISSGVSAAVVTEQYYEIEYEVNISEFWYTALDYSSYTKCRIYVPYCGIYDISIDEIQNGTLWLRYVVDVVSGSVVAFVGTKRVQKDGTRLRATLYQYNGNCILSMPVSQTNWQNIFSSVLNIANMAIAPSPSSVAGMAQDIMSQKVSVQKSGSISANFGYLGKQTPYVILERPELSIPVDYGHHEGYPANHKRKISEVHGYTEVKENTLIYNKFSGTDEEMEMLKSVLESGVYLD